MSIRIKDAMGVLVCRVSYIEWAPWEWELFQSFRPRYCVLIYLNVTILRVLNFAILLTLTFGGYELMRIYTGSDNDSASSVKMT